MRAVGWLLLNLRGKVQALMEDALFDVIVIGGAPAGVTAALKARELGATVALVERGRMGGTCTNGGCVPTRVLAKAAQLVREAQHFDDYGLVGARPAVDLAQLMARVQQTVYAIHEKKTIGRSSRTGRGDHGCECGRCSLC